MPTIKEDPADADVVSNKLLIRAGMVRQLVSGVYSYMPLGNRVLKKVEKIVREEQHAAGFQEVLNDSSQTRVKNSVLLQSTRLFHQAESLNGLASGNNCCC
jgi:prolyl-tRNA synthetase